MDVLLVLVAQWLTSAAGWVLTKGYWGYYREGRGAFRLLPLFGLFGCLQALCNQALAGGGLEEL